MVVGFAISVAVDVDITTVASEFAQRNDTIYLRDNFPLTGSDALLSGHRQNRLNLWH